MADDRSINQVAAQNSSLTDACVCSSSLLLSSTVSYNANFPGIKFAHDYTTFQNILCVGTETVAARHSPVALHTWYFIRSICPLQQLGSTRKPLAAEVTSSLCAGIPCVIDFSRDPQDREDQTSITSSRTVSNLQQTGPPSIYIEI